MEGGKERKKGKTFGGCEIVRVAFITASVAGSRPRSCGFIVAARSTRPVRPDRSVDRGGRARVEFSARNAMQAAIKRISSNTPLDLVHYLEDLVLSMLSMSFSILPTISSFFPRGRLSRTGCSLRPWQRAKFHTNWALKEYVRGDLREHSIESESDIEMQRSHSILGETIPLSR